MLCPAFLISPDLPMEQKCCKTKGSQIGLFQCDPAKKLNKTGTVENGSLQPFVAEVKPQTYLGQLSIFFYQMFIATFST